MERYAAKENYITYSPDLGFWRAHANARIIECYSDIIRGRCGDLGCNHGACTLLLLELVPVAVSEIVGFDMNASALQVARETAAKLRGGGAHDTTVEFVEADLVTRLPVDDGTFDFLMSFHVLEHVYPEDADAFVSEAFRALRPGGSILISIPYDTAYPDAAHVAFYKEDTLCDLFQRNGFTVSECIKDDRWNQKDLLTGVFVKKKK